MEKTMVFTIFNYKEIFYDFNRRILNGRLEIFIEKI